MADTIKTNLGPVTAYADAKAHGYTGTRDEFGQLLANAGLNLKAAETAKKGAEAAKQAAETAQQAAAENQKNAETQAAKAKASADSAAEQANAAKESAAGAANSATAAQESETNAGLSATAAANAEATAKQAQQAAETAKTDAEAAQTAAGNSADAAANSAADAKKTLESIPDDYSTLSGKVDEHTSGISKLNEDLGDLNDKKITKFYASNLGETHISDSDNGKIMDMMIYGKSEQFTTTGKNLFYLSVGGFISNTDGSINSGNISHIGVTDFIKINGKDITVIARNFSLTMKDAYAYRIGFYNSEKAWIKNIILTNKEKYSISTAPVTDAEYIRVSAPSTIYNTIQVEYGSEATAYEPYTGGQPSPSPDYPQEIKSVVNPTVKVSSEDETESQTVTLPYTLNAIPVSSGGNVTIDGQQYIADYVDIERGKLVRMVDSSKLDNTQSIVDKTEWLLAAPQETDLTTKEITAFKALATYYPVTNISINSEQLDGYTVFNYPISMENGWNYVKQQIGDTREYIYDMDAKTQDIDTQSAEAYVNSEYAVALTELEV